MSGSKENVRAYEEDECQGLLQDLEVIHANHTETAVLALETCVIFIYIYIYQHLYSLPLKCTKGIKLYHNWETEYSAETLLGIGLNTLTLTANNID